MCGREIYKVEVGQRTGGCPCTIDRVDTMEPLSVNLGVAQPRHGEDCVDHNYCHHTCFQKHVPLAAYLNPEARRFIRQIVLEELFCTACTVLLCDWCFGKFRVTTLHDLA